MEEGIPAPMPLKPEDLEKAKRLMSAMRSSREVKPTPTESSTVKPSASIRNIPRDPARELVPGSSKAFNDSEKIAADSLARSIHRIREDPRKQMEMAHFAMMEAQRMRNQTAGLVGLVIVGGALAFGAYLLYGRYTAAVSEAARIAAAGI